MDEVSVSLAVQNTKNYLYTIKIELRNGYESYPLLLEAMVVFLYKFLPKQVRSFIGQRPLFATKSTGNQPLARPISDPPHGVQAPEV
jgi:hypothetical protein